MRGPLAYIGGKNTLANQIIAIFPKHDTYLETFLGGGQVFFRKPPSKTEILNDLDGEMVNFFRVCQLHYEELTRYLRFMLVSRKWFDLLLATDRPTPQRLPISSAPPASFISRRTVTRASCEIP
jgi:site-specific DNA-adenine methylase